MLKKITLGLAVLFCSAFTFGNAAPVHASGKGTKSAPVEVPVPHGFCPKGTLGC